MKKHIFDIKFCKKLCYRNNHATNGIVHVVDKVIVPAEGTIADVLSADEHFKTMMDALEANNLGEMLSQPGHFTIFVPTDEAFKKLDDKTREKILGNGGCSADLIKSHILSEVKKIIPFVFDLFHSGGLFWSC